MIQKDSEENEGSFPKTVDDILLRRTKQLGKLRFLLMGIQWQARRVRRRY